MLSSNPDWLNFYLDWGVIAVALFAKSGLKNVMKCDDPKINPFGTRTVVDTHSLASVPR